MQTAEAEIFGKGDDALEKALEVHLQGEGQKGAGNGSAMSVSKTEKPLSEADSGTSGAGLEESAVQQARQAHSMSDRSL